MGGKSVATQADVQTQPGKTLLPGAASGAWAPTGPATVTPYPKLTIAGQPAISQAMCTFVFAGSAPDGTPVAGSDPVVLSAAALGKTVLQGAAQQVLRHGDQITSSFGNVISVSSSEKLRSG